jgi:hypothetical protein
MDHKSVGGHQVKCFGARSVDLQRATEDKTSHVLGPGRWRNLNLRTLSDQLINWETKVKWENNIKVDLREARLLIVEYQDKIYEHGNNSWVPRTKIWFIINNLIMALHYLGIYTMVLNIEAAVNFKIIFNTVFRF